MVRTRRLALALAVALATLPSSTFAQDAARFPPTLVLPNYQRIPVGGYEATEAGAFTARIRGPTSSWYNPAGLADTEKPEFKVSSAGFELRWVSLSGIGSVARSTRLAPLPSFVGAAVGPLFGRKLAVGASVATQASWGSSFQAAPTLPVDGFERLGYSAQSSFSTVIPSVAAGYRINRRFAVGLSLGIAATSLYHEESFSALLDAPQPGRLLRASRMLGRAYDLVASPGIKAQFGPHVQAGALFRLPGIHLTDSAQLGFDQVRVAAGRSDSVFFRDQHANFAFEFPLEVDVGAAASVGDFEFEVDLRLHGEAQSRNIVRSDEPVLLRSTTATGVTSDRSEVFTPIPYEAEPVLNWAVGGRYTLSHSWKLHAGFMTDFTPVFQEGTPLFQRADLYEVTAGASVASSVVTGSIGFAYEWGRSDPRIIAEHVSGEPLETRLTIRSFSLLYAIAFKL